MRNAKEGGVLRRAIREGVFLSCGAFLYTSAFPPYEWSGAAWVALAPLFALLPDKTPTTAFSTGFCYGVLCCCGVTAWVYFAIGAYFSFPFPWDLLVTFVSYFFFGVLFIVVVGSLYLLLFWRSFHGLCW